MVVVAESKGSKVVCCHSMARGRQVLAAGRRKAGKGKKGKVELQAYMYVCYRHIENGGYGRDSGEREAGRS